MMTLSVPDAILSEQASVPTSFLLTLQLLLPRHFARATCSEKGVRLFLVHPLFHTKFDWHYKDTISFCVSDTSRVRGDLHRVRVAAAALAWVGALARVAVAGEGGVIARDR